MIKFFRKIRQGLLTENKFSKYLLYAMGEIILVIIGILIALAINQYSTDINNNEIRELYIIQLIDEIDNNIQKLNEYRDDTDKRLAEIDTLSQILTNKDYQNPKLLLKSRYLYQRNTYTPIIVTYENLKFSGDLKLFNDIELINSISETYSTFENIKTVENIDLEVVNVYYQDYYMVNAKTSDLTLSSDNFGKDDYFENTTLVRKVTLGQNREEYCKTIESLKRLKNIIIEYQTSI